MRSFDFAPYYRSTVGFDQLFSMLDQVGGLERKKAIHPTISRGPARTTIAFRSRSQASPTLILRSKQRRTR